MLPTSQSFLEAAQATVNGPRANDYGRPSQNITRIAAFWSTLFGHPVTTQQVIQAMILVKQSRLVATPGHTDSLIDIAGYVACAEDCLDAEKPVELSLDRKSTLQPFVTPS